MIATLPRSVWRDPFLFAWEQRVQSCLAGSGASANLCPDVQHWQRLERPAEQGRVPGNSRICVQAGSVPRERVVSSRKVGWQRLRAVPALTESRAGGIWDFLLLQVLNLLNY